MKWILLIFFSYSVAQAQALEKAYAKGEYIYSVKIYKNEIQANYTFSNEMTQVKELGDLLNGGQFPVLEQVAYIGLEITGQTLFTKQQMIHWNYYDSNFNRLSKEITGLIQNASRVWLHPPRTQIFKMLELNPFPEIRFQESSWDTTLEVGSIWGDERWKTWEGLLTINSKYQYDKAKNEVVAEAATGVGKTQLRMEYDPKLGFKTLDFTTINGLRILMEFVKFEKEKL